jgi:hypothetical protein
LKRRVHAALDLVATQPQTGKVLKGELEGWWSVRVSRLRIIYRYSTTVVEVAAIGPDRLDLFGDGTPGATLVNAALENRCERGDLNPRRRLK